MTSKYKGWTIKTQGQVKWYPYKRFLAIARKEITGMICGFNIEGLSENQALIKAKDHIDNTMFDFSSDKTLIRPEYIS